MKWLKAAGAAILAILIAVLTLGASRRASESDAKDEKEADRLAGDIKTGLEDAKEHIADAGDHIDDGLQAKQEMDDELNKDVDDVFDDFNNRRVRRVPKRKDS